MQRSRIKLHLNAPDCCMSEVQPVHVGAPRRRKKHRTAASALGASAVSPTPICLLLVLLAHSAEARLWDIALPTDSCWIRKSFFFSAGGSVKITADVDGVTGVSRTATVFLCPAAVSGAWETCSSPSQDLNRPSSSGCKSQELSSVGFQSVEFIAAKAQQYHGGAMFSGAAGMTGTIKFVFLQPDGTHLGTDEKPVLKCALGITLTWAIMLFFWISAVIFHITKKLRISALQKLITIVPSLKVVTVGLFLVVKRAEDAEGEASLQTAIPYLVIVVVYRTILISTVLLIAVGWTVTRTTGSLNVNEKGIIAGLSLFHALSSLFDYLTTYVDSLSDSGWPPRVAIFLVAWSYVLAMWVAAFRYARVNVRALRYQCDLIRDAGIEPTSTPAFAKLRMFRYFWVFVAVYSIWDVFSSWAALSLPADINQWGSYLLRQVPEAMLGLGIGILFRPREFSPYTLITTDLQGNVGMQQLAGRPLGMDHETARELSRWTPGMPLPELPPAAFIPGSAAPPAYAGSIVIENPGDEENAPPQLALAVPCPGQAQAQAGQDQDPGNSKARAQAEWAQAEAARAQSKPPVAGPSEWGVVAGLPSAQSGEGPSGTHQHSGPLHRHGRDRLDSEDALDNPEAMPLSSVLRENTHQRRSPQRQRNDADHAGEADSLVI